MEDLENAMPELLKSVLDMGIQGHVGRLWLACSTDVFWNIHGPRRMLTIKGITRERKKVYIGPFV